MKSRIVIILFMLVAVLILHNTRKHWEGWVFRYDKSGYHLHLPAMLIYHDVSELKFYDYLEEAYQPSPGQQYYGINELENGKKINRYSIGLAVMELPFFLISHFINTYFLDYPADGYSLPYQYGGIISNLFWALMGLIVLRKFLLRYFSDTITAATLLAVAFGTNFYHYVMFAQGMTHPYSFFLFAMVLLYTDNLYHRNNKRAIYLLGAVLGLITITRSTNLIVALIPLFWGVNNIKKLKERFTFFAQNITTVSIGFLLFVLVLMIQLGYWKYITGSWVYDSFPTEGFVWSEPKIWEGLFGFRKGWFVYTPIALFMIAGLFSMRKRFAEHIPAYIAYMLINVYVIFSWWNWWYGGGFSCRPLIEALAILSLPLATLFTSIGKQKSKILYSISGVLLAFLITLNMFQSYQTYKNTLHWDKNTRAYYFKVFFKSNATAEDQQLLLSDKIYYNEMNERRKKANGGELPDEK